MAEVKEWAWKNLEVGESYDWEYQLTPAEIERYLGPMAIDNDWYTKDSPFGGPIAPPTWIAQLHASAIRTKYQNMAGAVHTRIDLETLAPAKLGQKIQVHGQLVDKQVRRGRRYGVWEFTSTAEDGTVIRRERREMLVSYAPVSGEEE